MNFCMKCGSPLKKREIENKERLGCSSASCDFVLWDNPAPVVAAIVERDGKIVLARNKAWPDKMFGLVTGFLERGETPEASVLREVKEELGLEGEVTRFVGYYPYFEMNQLILAFHVRAEGEIVLGEELADTRLIPPEKLRPWPMGTGLAVRDWLEMRKGEGTS